MSTFTKAERTAKELAKYNAWLKGGGPIAFGLAKIDRTLDTAVVLLLQYDSMARRLRKKARK